MKKLIFLFLAAMFTFTLIAQNPSVQEIVKDRVVTVNYESILDIPRMSPKLRQLAINSHREFQMIPRFPSFGMTKTEECVNKVVTRSFDKGELTFDYCDYLALPKKQIEELSEWLSHTETNHESFIQRVFIQKYFIAIWRLKM